MAGSFDGTLKFDTAIDRTGFEKGVSGIGELAKKGMAIVTGAITAASTAISVLGGYAVSVGKDFESSMAQVIATMGVTKDTINEDGINSYELLKEAAAAAGETTTFSASEAADALNYLALAGYDAAKAAEALPAVLDLAAAGGMELARASDLATDAMAALGIEATSDNLTEFGDKLAKTASTANTSVAQLGEAILTVGGTAKSLAGGTTELNAALGVLANRGIKAAEGGTHLRNMILSLSAPTDTARKALDSLGVSALDADGNMRPLNETFADLDKALAGMSDGDKAAILSDIFNKTDLSAAQALLAGCGEEFDSLTAALNNCDGAMADMAATMNDTLEGDLKSLSSKAEAFGIAIYDNLNAPLRDLAKLGGEYVSQLTAAFKEGGFEGLAEGLGGVLANAVTELSGYVPKFVEMGVSLVSALVRGLVECSPQIAEAAISAGVQLLDGIMSISGDLLELVYTLEANLMQGFAERVPDIVASAQSFLVSIVDAISENYPLMAEASADLMAALIEGFAECLPTILDAAINIVVAMGKALIATIPTLIKAVVSAIPLIINALIGCIPDLIDGAVQLFMAIVDALPIIIEILVDELPNIIVAIVEALIEATPQILEAAGRMFMAIVEALPRVLVALAAGLGELLGKVGEALGSAIAAVGAWAGEMSAKAGQAAKDFLDNVVEFFKELPYKIGEFIGEAIENVASWAVEMGERARSTAKDFLDNIVTFFKELPHRIYENLTAALDHVVSWGTDLGKKAKTAARDMFNNMVDTIKDLPEKMLETGKDIVKGIWDGITNMGQWIKDKIFGFADGIIDGFKSAFGIHSPSTVMRDSIGKFLAEGIGEGFIEGLPNIAEEAREALTNLDLDAPQVGIDIMDPEAVLSNPTELKFSVPKIKAPELEISVPDIAIPELEVAVSYEEVPQLQLEAPDFSIPELEISVPDIDIPELKLIVPNIELPELTVDVPDVELPKLEISVPDIELPKLEIEIPDFPKPEPQGEPAPKFDIDTTDEPKRSPAITDDAVSAIGTQILSLDRYSAAPSATSDIINNQYNYSSSTVNNNGAGAPEPQPIVLNAQFVVGEEVVAEGVLDIVEPAIDERQGLRVTMKRRGVTT